VQTFVSRRPLDRLHVGAWAAVAAVALTVALVAAQHALAGGGSQSLATAGQMPSAQPQSTHAPALLSAPAAAAISARLGVDESSFHLVGLRAANPAQHFTSAFSRDGAVTLAAGRGGTLRLALHSYGSYATQRLLTPNGMQTAAASITYHYSGLSAVYRNGPLGLEQTFNVARRPDTAAGPLVIEMTLGGSTLRAHVSGTRVLFGGGGSPLSYDGLRVVDATGRVLAARLVLAHGELRIVINDRGARYPLHVDPYIQQGGNLTGTGESANGFFGLGGAISPDGSTVIVGAPQSSTGVAYVFGFSGGSWTQQAALTLADAPSSAYFGDAIALSTNGDVAVIGAPNAGVTAIFTRSGSTWTQADVIDEPAHIVGFGDSVALSAAGTTAVIGDSGALSGSNVSTAFVYDGSGASWTQASEFDPAGESSNGDTFSTPSVAISADGQTAIFGNPANKGGDGSAWVYSRSGNSWSEQAGPLSGTGAIGAAGFGAAVALSSNGNTAAIGAPNDNCYDGAGYVFTRSGSSWSQQSAKLGNIGLIGSCPQGGPTFGESAAISADGTAVLFGGGDPAVFHFTGGSWGEFQTDLLGGGGVGLSSNGALALSTCPGCGVNGRGQAYVYDERSLIVFNPPLPVLLAVVPSSPQTVIGDRLLRGARAARAGSVTVRYRVNVKGSVTFQLLRGEPGVRVNGACVQSAVGISGAHCTRPVMVAHSTLGMHKGVNHFVIPGSSFGKAGRYTLRLIANRPGERRSALLTRTITVKG
jgi:hypothetical protein